MYQSINSSYLDMYLSINAFFGPAVASLFTCLLARYLFTYDWDWNIGMMFGSILSATDPVAVVALLRDLGQSPHTTWWKGYLTTVYSFVDIIIHFYYRWIIEICGGQLLCLVVLNCCWENLTNKHMTILQYHDFIYIPVYNFLPTVLRCL